MAPLILATIRQARSHGNRSAPAYRRPLLSWTGQQHNLPTRSFDTAFGPLVATVAIVVFRRPLSKIAGGLAGRISKLTVMSVGIELAQANEAPIDWVASGAVDFRGLTEATMLTDSFTDTLLASLNEAGSIDFIVVDLGSGHSWLSTRLFLFTAFLRRMRDLRAIVFVIPVRVWVGFFSASRLQ